MKIGIFFVIYYLTFINPINSINFRTLYQIISIVLIDKMLIENFLFLQCKFTMKCYF